MLYDKDIRDPLFDFLEELYHKIIERVPHDILKIQISDELFERDYHQIEDIICTYKAGKNGSP